MPFLPGPTDPFYELMQPPADETPAQKTARQIREHDAQRTNDIIDEDIKQERALAKKEKKVIKVLILGQSESGKSTTLKNFRMKYAQDEWERERDGWRTVVQLNIVRSIITILKVIESEMNGDIPLDSEDEQPNAHELNAHEAIKFTDRHQLLMIRLAPLMGVEADLKRQLGAGSEEFTAPATPLSATPFDTPDHGVNIRKKPEFSVRSWKEVLNPQRGNAAEGSTSNRNDTIAYTIANCKEDMKALWEDKTVRIALKRHKVHLNDSAGFFLNDLDRVASKDYVITDDDIVRARLRTVGIQEHRIYFKQSAWENPKWGQTSSWEWRIFDVGGCRTKRSAWIPYFDNVNVVIFLSPVSVFDQHLEEDPQVNRLEDSIILWTSICSSRLLARTQLILFLNKCDLLRRKLKRGVQVKQHLPSYGDRPNEVMAVVKYLREKFKDIQKQNSPSPRTCYIYPTTVTDTTATGTTLETVRDGVLRENLAASQLI